MHKKSKGLGAQVSGFLENGYFKLFGLVTALVAYAWQGATWKTNVEGQFNMVSYQVAELDRRMATEMGDIRIRVAKAEANVDPATSPWRQGVLDALRAQSEQMKGSTEALGQLSDRVRNMERLTHR